MDRHTARLALLAALFLSSCFLPGIESQRFERSLSAEELGLRTEKLTHLHFFTYEKFAEPGITVVRVAQASMTNQSSTLFGAVNVADEPILLSPDKAAKVIGRFQGLSAAASQSELALLQAFNFAFTEGKCNGSALTMIGRNPVSDKVREMPIVGGSGVFQFARGYAETRTHSTNNEENSSFVEYDIYALHY